VDEFRKGALVEKIAKRIRDTASGKEGYTMMDVCGTHTMSIFRFGLKSLIPKNISLVSGPGCPVCVTPNSFLDKAIELAKRKNTIIATFGDMLRVPGSYSSLEKERARGASVRVVYSTLDALALARAHPTGDVIFLGIGFETTAPTVAQSILIAKKEGLKNYSVLCGHKTMPLALAALAGSGDVDIYGFILPGHVSAITGSRIYGFLAGRYSKRCVIAGFEPLDIMQGILMLILQKHPKVEIQYKRVINERGNLRARQSMNEVFQESDSAWRGMGIVKKSGLKIRPRYVDFDAEARFKPRLKETRENKLCRCGDVLRGIKTPLDCALFARVCSPENPIGACMVSSEGTCAAYYRYGTHNAVAR
jgi:hydrogenase expression/formation protein HypD